MGHQQENDQLMKRKNRDQRKDEYYVLNSEKETNLAYLKAFLHKELRD